MTEVTCPGCGFAGPAVCFGEAPGRPDIDRVCPGCEAVLELPTPADPVVSVLHGAPDRDGPGPTTPDGGRK